MLWIVVLLVTVPVVVGFARLTTPRASRARWDAYAAGFVPAAAVLAPPRSARGLSDEQLRRAWHDSEATLRRTGPTLELIELRRHLLDEHDRRHPDRTPGADVDWDRLLRQA